MVRPRLNSASINAKARAKRMAEFARRFPEVSDMSVIDLGGFPDFWLASEVRPRHVTVVNLDPINGASIADGGLDPELPWLTCIVADACRYHGAPADLVFSNSLLEHVGGIANREALAGTVRRLAPHHWVQTPYRYFPIEPHWRIPGFQFLPLPARSRLGRRRWTQNVELPADEALHESVWTELLSITEMRYLFPESEIWFERYAGLVKSLVAVK